MRRNLLALSTIMSLALVTACSDDSEGGKQDSGMDPDSVILRDGGSVGQEGGTVGQDGGQAQQDTGGTPSGLSCIEIIQCIQQTCPQPTEACVNDCKGQGSTDAEADFDALLLCQAQAGQGTGTCAAPCVTPASSECQNCLMEACQTEFETCTGTGGPEIDGFGDSCDPQAQNCPGDLDCLGLQGYAGAFCSTTCETVGLPCAGAPEGTFAACIMQVSGGGLDGNYCAFLCKLPNGAEYECPTGLICDPVGNQGQHSCMPPAAQ